jgi:outer membrane protein TolC
LIVPLGGNIKGRNLYGAAKLSTQEAYLALHGMQTEIGNEINFSIQKSRAWQQSIQSYETVVHYNEALLDTQTKRLSAGTIDGHKVLEVEADLLDARQNLANALVQYRHSLLEVEIASGEILRHRQLEVTQQDLKRQTTAYLQRVESPRE